MEKQSGCHMPWPPRHPLAPRLLVGSAAGPTNNLIALSLGLATLRKPFSLACREMTSLQPLNPGLILT